MTYPDTPPQDAIPAPDAGAPAADAPTPGAVPDAPVITVIEPEVLAPLGRLRQWLLAEGATIRMVRPGAGDPVPALEEIDGALVVLGGAMSAHSEDDHPWIVPLRGLLAQVVTERVPAVAICLGAQIAAEALGGTTTVPAPDHAETGVVDLQVTRAGRQDALFAEMVTEGLRAAGPSGRNGTLPVIVSHGDAVTRLPEQAVLLASSSRSPVHTWRAGRLLAFQHHPESDPVRVGYWRTRDALTERGLPPHLAREQAADLTGVAPAWPDAPAQAPDPESLREAVATGRLAREQAEAVDPAVQAFGRALARVLVRSARSRRTPHASLTPRQRHM